MSLNQSGLRRAVSENELDAVPKGVRSADLLAGAFFFGLNIIAVIGDVTSVFSAYGGPNSGIQFLYNTFCFPAAVIVSRFLSLRGDLLYTWMMAEGVFIVSTFFVWLFVMIIGRIFKWIY